MKLSILAGATSQSANVFIQDSSSTTGAGLTGLAFNTGSLTAYYSFAGANATSAVISLQTLAAVNSAWSSAGFKEIDATNMPGWYRLDIPNAALATSKGRSVAIHLKGATNMAPCPIEIELTGWDNQDSVHGGLTCLPNTAVTTNASLLTSGTGTAQVSVSSGQVTVATNNDKTGYSLSVTPPTSAAIATAVWQDTTAGDFTTALSVGKSVMNGVSLGTGLTIASVSGAVGSVTGAVGSVTGAVGSVTGAVGSVTGAVGSVTAGVTVTTNNDKTGYSLSQTFPTNFSALGISAGGHISTVDTLTTYTGNTVQTGDAYARLGAPAGASTAADIAAINTKTTNLPGSPAAVGSAMTLTSGERTSVADALLDRDMSTGTDSGSTTVRTVRQALRFLRNKWAVAAGVVTVYKEDDSTSSWTSALSTNAAAIPVIGSDPAGP